MEVDNIFQWDMPLQKMSAIICAVNVWDSQDVKKEIEKFFQNPYSTPYEKRKKWRDVVIKYVIEKVNSFGFKSKREIIANHAINEHAFAIGGLIFDFIHHITESGIDIRFGLKIIWAPYGRIDELKMARNWVNKGRSVNGFHGLADICTDQEFISQYVEETKEKVMSEICAAKNCPKTPKLDEESVKTTDMFTVCFVSDTKFLFAARYFWNSLSVEEKNNNVVKAAEKCVELSQLTEKNLAVVASSEIRVYIQQKQTELLLFFICNMSKEQRTGFVSNYHRQLFDIFLKTWPHQELCLNIIKHVNHETLMKDQYFSSVLRYVLPDGPSNDIFYDNIPLPIIAYQNQNVYHAILKKLLPITSISRKENSFKKNPNCFLYRSLNKEYVTISIVVKDGSLEKILKPRMIFYEFFKQYDPLSPDCKDLNQYLKHVLSDEKIKESFKQKLNAINANVFDGNFDKARKFLHLDDTYPEESPQTNGNVARFSLEDVDPMHFCKFFLEERFDLAEDFATWLYHDKSTSSLETYRYNLKKTLHGFETVDPEEFCWKLLDELKGDVATQYLKWRFETEEERQEVKNKLRIGTNFRLRPYQVWCSIEDTLCRESKCLEYLKFFLKTDENVNKFRKNQLFEEDRFFRYFKEASRQASEDFLKFCCLAPNRIESILGQWERNRKAKDPEPKENESEREHEYSLNDANCG